MFVRNHIPKLFVRTDQRRTAWIIEVLRQRCPACRHMKAPFHPPLPPPSAANASRSFSRDCDSQNAARVLARNLITRSYGCARRGHCCDDELMSRDYFRATQCGRRAHTHTHISSQRVAQQGARREHVVYKYICMHSRCIRFSAYPIVGRKRNWQFAFRWVGSGWIKLFGRAFGRSVLFQLDLATGIYFVSFPRIWFDLSFRS